MDWKVECGLLLGLCRLNPFEVEYMEVLTLGLLRARLILGFARSACVGGFGRLVASGIRRVGSGWYTSFQHSGVLG